MLWYAFRYAAAISEGRIVGEVICPTTQQEASLPL